MRKIYLFILCAVSMLLSFNSAKAQDNIIDEVIWVVGDDAILKSEVEDMRIQMQIEGQRLTGDPYCIIPEQMAIQKLFLHQAKLDSINTNESQVLQHVEMKINDITNQLGSKEKVEEYLKKPITQLREEWKDAIREQQVVQEMQQKIVGTIKINPADVRRYFNRLPQDSLPFIPTTVEVQIITVEPKISLSEIDKVKERLREFTEKITSGEKTFSSYAVLYSEDKESAKRGGELGFKGKGMLVPEFAAVAFDLNESKKVSRIVETELGYHIIQLIEKRGERINVRHILLKPTVSQAELNEASIKLDSIRSDISKGKFAFDEAANFLSYDKDTRNNKGLMVNKERPNASSSERTGTSRFEMFELPPEIGKVVNTLQIGDVSKPFSMINDKQKEVIAIIKLKSRVEGHKANIADDYQSLKRLVEYEKKEEILDKWITKKQKDTYIRINDNWKNCDFQRGGWVKQ